MTKEPQAQGSWLQDVHKPYDLAPQPEYLNSLNDSDIMRASEQGEPNRKLNQIGNKAAGPRLSKVIGHILSVVTFLDNNTSVINCCMLLTVLHNTSWFTGKYYWI